MLDLTGDQAYVSAIVVAEYLPAVVLGTILGHLLDRVPPRSGLAACELLAAAAWALMVTTGRAGHDRRARADLRRDDGDLQDRLDRRRADARRRRRAGRRANGSILSAETLTNIAGVAVGGALVGLTSANVVLLLNAVTFVLSGALLLAFSRVPRHAPRSPEAGSDRQPCLAARAPLVGARRCLQTPALRMILFSLPVASVALGISIAAIVPTLRDTYGASNLQTGGDHGDRGPRNRDRHALPARYAGYLSGMALLAIGWGGFGIAPDLLVAAPLVDDRGHGQRRRDRALPHDDAAQHAAARARQHDRVRVRSDVQHDRRRHGRRRSARRTCSVSGRRSRPRARSSRSAACRGALLAERRPRGQRVTRRLPRPPPSLHDNHDYVKYKLNRLFRASGPSLVLQGNPEPPCTIRGLTPICAACSGHALGMGLREALGRRRMLEQLLRRPDRAAYQVASAVRADPAESPLGAVRAERALIRADARLCALGRQVAVAALAVRKQHQHGREYPKPVLRAGLRP